MTIILLAAAAATAVGAAELVPVPLDLGEPPLFIQAGETASVPFDAGRPLEGMTGGAVALRGSGDFLRTICWTFGGYGGGQWLRREDEGLTVALKAGDTVVAEATLRYAEADYPGFVGVNFDTTLVLAADDWSALAGGTGTIVFGPLDCDYFPSYPEVCICDPSAGLLEATFVATVGDGVPVVPAAWGAVKARYR
ncbi:MAG: hypothetical protein IH621_04045 [Krumholzibacteria bacterium]|nr:hypothetical protein [Candidatus Krumholzibacteria bacterium]